MAFSFGRSAISLVLIASLAAWSAALSSDSAGRALSLSLLLGTAFGIVLQRGRFCFLCNFRDLVEQRKPDGVLSILAALGFGIIFYTVIVMAWVPVPQPDRLPPNAHVGPVGFVLAAASAAFGFGMALSGSCLSGHFYRIGEGAFGSIVALLGAALGFLAGFVTWNGLFTLTVFDDPPLWLPRFLGHGGALLAGLAAVAALTVATLWLGRRPATGPETGAQPTPLAGALQALFVHRWPPVLTGILVAAIGAFAYLRIAPIGVTAELGSLVRTAATPAGIIPETLGGLDTLRGCVSAVKTTILSPNGLFVIGLIAGSFASALSAGQFRPVWPDAKGLARRLAGGILMGWGAMTALGCTVGVLLSGIHAGAVSGWVFLVFSSLGAFAGLALLRRGWL
ncbi:YeeE/YedE family protein [Rhizobiaceae bacterium BDR2-2]|uniref:YeeE/YedE family protein n=1 Tax=Ectorhizobium quercum TaxID=2965071 RepID=A0AAE3N290_9HYPH|nr:YeeE/YedE family protein [Ectorhizobium quercum]MCX8999678.1 YeeE/YedE family protein [Ectorhizobium quercum]